MVAISFFRSSLLVAALLAFAASGAAAHAEGGVAERDLVETGHGGPRVETGHGSTPGPGDLPKNSSSSSSSSTSDHKGAKKEGPAVYLSASHFYTCDFHKAGEAKQAEMIKTIQTGKSKNKFKVPKNAKGTFNLYRPSKKVNEESVVISFTKICKKYGGELSNSTE